MISPTLRRFWQILPLFCLILACFSCQKNDPTPVPEPEMFKVENLGGYVQKGPFSIGATLTIGELNANFGQTGKTFNTTIQDNSGRFEIRSITLASPVVEVRASGFYFDEVAGTLSAAPLELSALANLNQAATLNINVLAHLEESRVRTLLDQKVAFAEAKRRAQTEVLAIFDIQPGAQAVLSEQLDITADGTGNAALLAVSVILQASRSVGELSELMASMRADLKADGVLNDVSLGSKLVNGVKYLDLSKVRKNLERRYADLKLTVKIPAFEPLIEQFLKNTKFPYTFRINYPAEGQYGPNILALPNNVAVRTDRQYSVTAMPTRDAVTRIRMTLLDSTAKPGSGFGFPLGNNTGWVVTAVSPLVRDLTATTPGIADMSIQFDGINRCKVEFFENNAPQPVETKQIAWGIPDPNVDLTYPAKNDAGFANFFAMPYSNTLTKGKYSLTVDLPKNQEREIQTTFLISSGTVAVDQTLPADWTVTKDGANLILKVKGKNKRAQITLQLTTNSGLMNIVSTVDGKMDLSLDRKVGWQ
jgi:hypothetical protein